MSDEEQPLVFPFERTGFRHVLLRRDGDVCLVERTNLRVKPPSVHWEVIVIQHKRERTLPNGEVVGASEGYPQDELWGEAGWTYTNRSQADARMADLCRPRSKPDPETPE
jgi:hypothetical protein